MNKIYNKDCIIGMKTIPDETIDLVVTDPPFAINFKSKKANYNRTASRVLAGYNEWGKGASLGEAVNEGLWFIPGKHSRSLNELLGPKTKGKLGRNLPVISDKNRAAFDLLTDGFSVYDYVNKPRFLRSLSASEFDVRNIVVFNRYI